jgi:hypothetical protein
VWAIVAIIAAVVIAGTATTIILTRDSDEPSEAQPPVTLEPTGGPPSAQLSAYLPPEVTNCRGVEPGPQIVELGPTVLEAVNCEPPDPPLGGGVTVGFYLYPDAPSVSTAYQAILSAIGLDPDTGDCEATLGEGPAEQGWSGAGGQGRLLCRPTPDGGSALFWTSDGYPVLGVVLATNPVADVYVYWQMLSDYTLPGGAAELAAAPLDQLRAFLPPEVSDCDEQAPGDLFPGEIAVLVCDSPDAGATAGFRLFPTEAAATSALQAIQQQTGVETDSGDCVSGVAGEESWSGAGGQGRLICGYVTEEGEERSSVLWSSEGFPILGEIRGRSGEPAIEDIYAIWQGVSDYQPPVDV